MDSLAPNSLRALLDAYVRLRDDARAFAVATVVRVEGSAFRRAGARMLIVPDPATDFAGVTDEPHTWGRLLPPTTLGTISGGCLEAEVACHGLDVVRTLQARTISLTSRLGDADRAAFGVGCGGTVHVLLQPVCPGTSGPLDAVVRAVRERRAGALSVVTEGSPRQLGAHRFVDGEGHAEGTDDGPILRRQLEGLARAALTQEAGSYVRGLSASSQSVAIWTTLVCPPLHLVVFGTGPDARALTRQAQSLGWETTVVGFSSVPEVARDIPEADHVRVVRTDADPLRDLQLDTGSAAVVMTHSFVRDRDLVAALAASPVPYLGLLGSRRRTARLLADLADAGLELAPRRLHAPVGLDLGADTPEEIALEVCAEILRWVRRQPEAEPAAPPVEALELA